MVAGIDEAMARHAKETDRVDLLTLKQLKARVNALEQQIVQDKARQLTVRFQLLFSAADKFANACYLLSDATGSKLTVSESTSTVSMHKTQSKQPGTS